MPRRRYARAVSNLAPTSMCLDITRYLRWTLALLELDPERRSGGLTPHALYSEMELALTTYVRRQGLSVGKILSEPTLRADLIAFERNKPHYVQPVNREQRDDARQVWRPRPLMSTSLGLSYAQSIESAVQETFENSPEYALITRRFPHRRGDSDFEGLLIVRAYYECLHTGLPRLKP